MLFSIFLSSLYFLFFYWLIWIVSRKYYTIHINLKNGI
nr:MAG TPA: hypothetical protein [Caudoviricetes sp.]